MHRQSPVVSALLVSLLFLTSCTAPNGPVGSGRPTADLIPRSDLKASPNVRSALTADLMLAEEIEERAYSAGHGGYSEFLSEMQSAFSKGRFKSTSGANIGSGSRSDYVGVGGPRYHGGTPPQGGSVTPQPAKTGRAGFEEALQQKMRSGELKSMSEMTITYPDGTRRVIKP